MRQRAFQVAGGSARAAFLFGPPGIGKTHCLDAPLVQHSLAMSCEPVACAPRDYKELVALFDHAAQRNAPLLMDEADVVFRSERMLTILNIALDPKRSLAERVYQGTPVTAPLYLTTNADLFSPDCWSPAMKKHGEALLRRAKPRGISNAVSDDDLWEYSVALALQQPRMLDIFVEESFGRQDRRRRKLETRCEALKWFTEQRRNLRSRPTPAVLESVALAFDIDDADERECELAALLIAPERQTRPLTDANDWRTAYSGESGRIAHATFPPDPQVIEGDCLEKMRAIPSGSVDLLLADDPYEVSNDRGADWRFRHDKRIPEEPLWAEYRRIIKPTGTIILFAAGKFTFDIQNRGRDLFKYKYTWIKDTFGNHRNANNRPLTVHEDILVFSGGACHHQHASSASRRMTYNPQGLKKNPKAGKYHTDRQMLLGNISKKVKRHGEFTNFPTDKLEFAKDREPIPGTNQLHPFAKPVDLLEHLIRTYSNEGELVVDNCCGSGSTLIAAMRCGRRSIGIEIDPEWVRVCRLRIDAERAVAKG